MGDLDQVWPSWLVFSRLPRLVIRFTLSKVFLSLSRGNSFLKRLGAFFLDFPKRLVLGFFLKVLKKFAQRFLNRPPPFVPARRECVVYWYSI